MPKALAEAANGKGPPFCFVYSRRAGQEEEKQSCSCASQFQDTSSSLQYLGTRWRIRSRIVGHLEESRLGKMFAFAREDGVVMIWMCETECLLPPSGLSASVCKTRKRRSRKIARSMKLLFVPRAFVGLGVATMCLAKCTATDGWLCSTPTDVGNHKSLEVGGPSNVHVDGCHTWRL